MKRINWNKLKEKVLEDIEYFGTAYLAASGYDDSVKIRRQIRAKIATLVREAKRNPNHKKVYLELAKRYIDLYRKLRLPKKTKTKMRWM